MKHQLVGMRDDENGVRKIGLLHKMQRATNTKGDKVHIEKTQFQSKMEELEKKPEENWGKELDHFTHANATTRYKDFRIKTATGLQCDTCLQEFRKVEDLTLHRLEYHVGEGYLRYPEKTRIAKIACHIQARHPPRSSSVYH